MRRPRIRRPRHSATAGAPRPRRPNRQYPDNRNGALIRHGHKVPRPSGACPCGSIQIRGRTDCTAPLHVRPSPGAANRNVPRKLLASFSSSYGSCRDSTYLDCPFAAIAAPCRRYRSARATQCTHKLCRNWNTLHWANARAKADSRPRPHEEILDFIDPLDSERCLSQAP